MAPVYKIALIQFQPKAVDPKANFTKASSYIRKAAAQGAHLAVLPEYHLTSWVPEDPEFVSSSRASGAYLSRYQDLARELNISIVPGTICDVRDLDGDEAAAAKTNGAGREQANGTAGGPAIEMRNMAYFLAAGTGAVAGTYQKKNLWHPERPHLTSSGFDPHTAFDTPLLHADGATPVRAGMLVCWDLAFPEAFRALIADGADLIVIPSFWHMSDVDERARALNPWSEKVFLEAAMVSRAYENTCAVVYVNTGGLSQLAMPILGALGLIGVDEEEMKVVDLDLEVLKLAEENYKVRADMKKGGWHYGYTLQRDDKGEGCQGRLMELVFE